MKFNKILVFIIALFLFGFLTVDLLMTKYGTKKFYEIKEKNSIIQDSLAEGLIAYKNDHFTFYKWNITSVKEIEHKNVPLK